MRKKRKGRKTNLEMMKGENIWKCRVIANGKSMEEHLQLSLYRTSPASVRREAKYKKTNMQIWSTIFYKNTTKSTSLKGKKQTAKQIHSVPIHRMDIIANLNLNMHEEDSVSKESSSIWNTERTNFQRCGDYKRSFWRISDSKLVMHEATFYNWLILENNLVAIAAFQAFLVTITLVPTVLHLLEIPYDTEFANTCNKMPFLLSALCDLHKLNRSQVHS